MAQKINKTLATEYLKSGFRVFLTDSPDNALLVIRVNHKSKLKRPVISRLETNTYSIPFTGGKNTILDIKVRVVEELFRSELK